MPRITREIAIDVPPKKVWTLIVQHLKYPGREVQRGPEWKKLVIKDLKGEALTPSRSGNGVKTRWYYKFHFYTFKWDDEVIEWKEFEKITWKAISTWEMVDSFEVKPVNGGTVLIYDMRYSAPYGVLGRIWYRLFVHKHLEKHLEYVLKQMKQNAEATARLPG